MSAIRLSKASLQKALLARRLFDFMGDAGRQEADATG
jgi:hypothetical protein